MDRTKSELTEKDILVETYFNSEKRHSFISLVENQSFSATFAVFYESVHFLLSLVMVKGVPSDALMTLLVSYILKKGTRPNLYASFLEKCSLLA